MQNSELRTRFAPSPTGNMHIGNLRTALYSYLYARKHNGKLILRIEDTDQSRQVEGSVEVIIETLKKVGIDYDEGPLKGGPYAPYVQSQRKNDYFTHAKTLIEKGHAYYCFCTKERLEHLPDINGARKYDRHCLHLSKEEVIEKLKDNQPFVIRQKMPDEGASVYTDLVFGPINIDHKELEDQVLVKSDLMPTYNFANVVDDHQMAINCVIRGSEYLSSTPKYNLLYEAFGWEKPIYIHLPPVMRDATHKLSKRNGDPGFNDLVERGYLTQAIVNYICLLGWSPKNDKEKLSWDELRELFGLEGLSRSSAIFDEAKLKWLNSQYIKELPAEEFLKLATPYLDKSKVKGKYDYTYLCKLIQSRIDTLGEIAEKVNFLEEFGGFDNNLYAHAKLKTTPELAKQVLPQIREELVRLDAWTETAIHDALINLVARLQLKNGQILWPLRVAISGKESTAGGAVEIAYLVGKDETLRRLDFSLGKL